MQHLRDFATSEPAEVSQLEGDPLVGRQLAHGATDGLVEIGGVHARKLGQRALVDGLHRERSTAVPPAPGGVQGPPVDDGEEQGLGRAAGSIEALEVLPEPEERIVYGICGGVLVAEDTECQPIRRGAQASYRAARAWGSRAASAARNASRLGNGPSPPVVTAGSL